MTEAEIKELLYGVISDHGLEQDYCYCDQEGCHGSEYLSADSMADAVYEALVKKGVIK